MKMIKNRLLWGRELLLKKKVGDLVLENQVDQFFCLTNPTIATTFQELLDEISIEIIEISYEIISYAKKNMKKKLNDTLFISVVDHRIFLASISYFWFTLECDSISNYANYSRRCKSSNYSLFWC